MLISPSYHELKISINEWLKSVKGKVEIIDINYRDDKLYSSALIQYKFIIEK